MATKERSVSLLFKELDDDLDNLIKSFPPPKESVVETSTSTSSTSTSNKTTSNGKSTSTSADKGKKGADSNKSTYNNKSARGKTDGKPPTRSGRALPVAPKTPEVTVEVKVTEKKENSTVESKVDIKVEEKIEDDKVEIKIEEKIVEENIETKSDIQVVADTPKEEKKFVNVDEIKEKEEVEVKRLRTLNGFLSKQGHVVKNWQVRYFVLKDQDLYYYIDNTQSKLKGKVPLGTSSVELVPPHEGRDMCFVIKTPQKDLILAALNPEERMDWMNAVELAVHGTFSRKSMIK